MTGSWSDNDDNYRVPSSVDEYEAAVEPAKWSFGESPLWRNAQRIAGADPLHSVGALAVVTSGVERPVCRPCQ